MKSNFQLKIFIFVLISIISLKVKAQQTDFDDMKKRFKEINYKIEPTYSDIGPSFNITITFPKNYFAEEAIITVNPTFSGIFSAIVGTQVYVGSKIKTSDKPENSVVVNYSGGGSYSFKIIPKVDKTKVGDLKLDLVILLKTRGVTQEQLKYPYSETFTYGEGKIEAKKAEVKVEIKDNTTEKDTAKIENVEDNHTQKDTAKVEIKENTNSLNDILSEIAEYKKDGNTKKLAELNEKLGDLYYTDNKDYDKAKQAYLEAIENSKKNNTPVKTGDLYTDVGKTDYATENNLEAISDYYNALDLYKANGETKRVELTYNNLATIYTSMSYYENAINAYEEAIKNSDKDDATVAKYSSKIADAYQKMENLKKTAEYYEKAIELEKATGNKKELVTSYSNASTVYLGLGDYDKATEYINSAIKLNTETGETEKQPTLYNNLGNIYFEQENFNDAISNYQKSLELSQNLKDKERNQAMAYHNIGIVYFKKKDNENAKDNFVKSNEIAQVKGYSDIVAKNLFMLSKIVSQNILNDDDYNEFQGLLVKGSPYMLTYDKPMADYEEKYSPEMSKEQLIDELTNKDLELKKQKESIEKQMVLNEVLKLEKVAQETKNRQQRKIIWGLVFGILIVIILALIALREYILKRRANNELKHKNALISQQKEELQAQADELQIQNDKITEQNDKITEQNNKISSSIECAKNIQTAILPSDLAMKNLIAEHFVLYLPRDVVSGDFYWISKISEEEFIVVAADCTGHGVPGAMMSMLGTALLNEVVNSFKVTQPNLIANNLRELIIKSLNQDLNVDSEKLVKDGMDIAILKINRKNKKVMYAGAENPLIVVRNKELLEFKGDPMPIGATVFNKSPNPFNIYEIDLQKNDMLYIFSDGYVDQFGGPRKKKYFKSALYEDFIKISNKSTKEQKELLDSNFFKWKNYDGKENRQIDDVLIIGIRI